jgi:endonuclease V-like protein UPF0215 family
LSDIFMARHGFSNIIGFDDAPFSRSHHGNVTVVGAVFAGLRLDGVLVGAVRKDGANAARNLADLIQKSKFAKHIQLVMLQGIALGGFNVVDVPLLYRRLGLPVLVVARRQPDFSAIQKALQGNVTDGGRKWKLIKALGPMEQIAGICIQRVGLTLDEAENVITKFAVHGHIPEPLRTAHLIAGGIVSGQSRGRV